MSPDGLAHLGKLDCTEVYPVFVPLPENTTCEWTTSGTAPVSGFSTGLSLFFSVQKEQCQNRSGGRPALRLYHRATTSADAAQQPYAEATGRWHGFRNCERLRSHLISIAVRVPSGQQVDFARRLVPGSKNVATCRGTSAEHLGNWPRTHRRIDLALLMDGPCRLQALSRVEAKSSFAACMILAQWCVRNASKGEAQVLFWIPAVP